MVGSHLEWIRGEDDPVDPKDQLRVFDVYQRAADLTASGRLASTIDLLRQAAGRHPTRRDIWQELAHAFVRAGRFEQAARAYEHSAALDPTDAKALVAAAASLLRAGRVDEAQRDAETALDLVSDATPAQGAVQELLARIAIARRDSAGARAHAAAAQQVDPTLPRMSFVEGLALYGQGRYEDALAYFRQAAAALEGKPDQIADLHFLLGEALGHLERWDDAVSELTQEIELFPRNLRARASLALAYRAAGQPDEVERVLTELIGVAPTPEGYSVAARVWAAAGDSRRAESIRAEGRRRFRGDPTLKLLAQK